MGPATTWRLQQRVGSIAVNVVANSGCHWVDCSAPILPGVVGIGDLWGLRVCCIEGSRGSPTRTVMTRALYLGMHLAAMVVSVLRCHVREQTDAVWR